MTILNSAPLQPDVNQPEPRPVAPTGDGFPASLHPATPFGASSPADAAFRVGDWGGLWVSAGLAALAGVALLQGAILVGLLLVATLSVLLLASNRPRWIGRRRDSGGRGGVPDVGSSEGSAHGQAGDCGASDGGGGGCGD